MGKLKEALMEMARGFDLVAFIKGMLAMLGGAFVILGLI